MDCCANCAPTVCRIVRAVIRRRYRAAFVDCNVEGRGCGRRGNAADCVDMAEGEGELDDESEQRRLRPKNSM